jgi:hypothetical protein
MKINVFNFDYSKQKEFVFHLGSDFHFDNEAFDETSWRREFEEVKKNNWISFVGGDWGDFILLQDKKRYVKSRDQFDGDDIVNQIIDMASSRLRPYADNIALIGQGNHEDALVKYHSINPVSMLIQNLNNDKKNGTIKHGGYAGFIVLIFRHGDNGGTRKYTIYYNHGAGGNAEVTKGMIDFNRRQYVRCDLMWLQHKHTRIQADLDYEIGVDREFNIYEKEKKAVLTGSYLKNATIEEKNNKYIWNERRCRTTQARGGKLLYLYPSANGIRAKVSDT